MSHICEQVEIPTKLKPNGYLNLIPGANPGGRPKGIMRYAREQTKDGKELIDFALSVLRGTLVINRTVLDREGEPVTIEDSPSVRDRLQALEYVTDRGFGKAVEVSVDLTPQSELREQAAAIARELILQGVKTSKGQSKSPITQL
jgi:hypothetical protein